MNKQCIMDHDKTNINLRNQILGWKRHGVRKHSKAKISSLCLSPALCMLCTVLCCLHSEFFTQHQYLPKFGTSPAIPASYFSQLADSPLPDGGIAGVSLDLSRIAPPRAVGVTFRCRFLSCFPECFFGYPEGRSQRV